MMSFGPELLVIEMMGVIGSNWRINDVAETPANSVPGIQSARRSCTA